MGDKPRIVLADDDDAVCESLRVCLVYFGYEVTAVGGGLPLVEACRVAPPDVVVSDVQMPDLDGITAAAEIGRWGAPVVLMSGAWDDGTRERAARAGVAHCLAKLVSLAELVAVVRAAASARSSSAPAP